MHTITGTTRIYSDSVYKVLMAIYKIFKECMEDSSFRRSDINFNIVNVILLTKNTANNEYLLSFDMKGKCMDDLLNCLAYISNKRKVFNLKFC